MLGHCSWKRNRRSILLLSQTASVCCFLFLLINALRNNKKLKTTTERNEITHYEKVTFVKNSTESESPICTGNLLSGREYNYAKWARGSHDNRLESTTGSCRLLYYTTERIVTCLDSFHDQHNRFELMVTRRNISNISIKKKGLYFVFIGDSIIREQFLNFIRLIPDYDKILHPHTIPYAHHDNIEVTSNILRLRVVFQWRPFINVTVTETIRRWANSNLNAERPDLILGGMALHHMFQIHNADDYTQLYQKKLSELAPVLGQLAKVSNVIWLNQYPTMELNKPTSETVHKYNKDIRRIFKNHSNIRIWDSSNPLVEEYIRSCVILKRVNPDYFWETLNYIRPYFSCTDNLHPGNSVLSQATQLLLNDICNRYSII